MLARLLVLIRVPLAILLMLLCLRLDAQQSQQSSPAPSERANLPSGIDRIDGTEPSSHIQYVRFVLKGSLHAAAKGTADPTQPDPPPILIAQCSLRPGGKYFFEMFANFGGVSDPGFYPPWKPAGPQDLFPPRTEKVTITMDFLGYTHVKPFRRQWEIPVQTPSIYRYNPPNSGSSNLEEVSYFLRYLVSLPTLQLTLDNHAAQYLTTSLLAEVRKEPLCRAAGL